MNHPTQSHSFDDVAHLLAYAAGHPADRTVPVRVHGFYMAFQQSRGPAQFGVLLSRPEQIDDVERVNRIPAKIDFGINVAIRVQGIVSGIEPLTPPPDRSWVTLEGLLSWWEPTDSPLFCRLNVIRSATDTPCG